MIWDADKLRWARDGADWPHRDVSRFERVDGMGWHVQIWERDPSAPVALLLHGAGAATHSWRGLAPLLAERFTVIAPDLPAHGFTDTPWFSRLSMPGMARAVAALANMWDKPPALIVGHSAGAAVAARMVLDGEIAPPTTLIGVNAALTPFPGLAGLMFPTMARAFFANPLAVRSFAWSAAVNPGVVSRMLGDLGDDIDAQGQALYARLMASPAHVSGALGMMAQWDLDQLRRDLPRLPPQMSLLLIAGAADRAVPPPQAEAVARGIAEGRRPGAAPAEARLLPNLGHLAHEQDPRLVFEEITTFWDGVGAVQNVAAAS
ncbi:MAG: alpha/beta fold hydrolase [Rhodobacteraceae bacterium]|nr:alpha/beta fold hydrolase [Paracoccaceae bacterium]